MQITIVDGSVYEETKSFTFLDGVVLSNDVKLSNCFYLASILSFVSWSAAIRQSQSAIAVKLTYSELVCTSIVGVWRG